MPLIALINHQPAARDTVILIQSNGEKMIPIRISEDGNELIGDYEAGMQRNTAGRMRFVRVR